jgi:hypothetical protein
MQILKEAYCFVIASRLLGGDELIDRRPEIVLLAGE